jgi:hypothetical protein
MQHQIYNIREIDTIFNYPNNNLMPSFNTEWPIALVDPDEQIVSAEHMRRQVVVPFVNAVCRRANKHLVDVNLTRWRDLLDYHIFKPLVTYCTNMRKLNMTGIQLTNKSLVTLSAACTSLHTVILRRCFSGVSAERGKFLVHFRSVSLCAAPVAGLTSLFENCQQLHSIDISENEYLNGMQCFQALPMSTRWLELQYNTSIKHNVSWPHCR